jgi:hypothetical protein
LGDLDDDAHAELRAAVAATLSARELALVDQAVAGELRCTVAEHFARHFGGGYPEPGDLAEAVAALGWRHGRAQLWSPSHSV